MQHVGRCSSSAAGPGQFWCKCCDRQLAVAEISFRRSTCKCCSNAYKSLAERWSKNRRLKCWFDAMTTEQRRDWFVTNLTHSQGTKRKFDNVAYEDVSANREYVAEEEIDEYVPWKWFHIHGRMEGKTTAELERDFKSLVEDPTVMCKFTRGQWLVPEFKGVLNRVGAEQAQESIVARRKSNVGMEELQQLQRQGEMMRDQYRAQITAPAAKLVGLPYVEGELADQPIMAVPQDIFAKAAQRED